jgi:hypothetical protein
MKYSNYNTQCRTTATAGTRKEGENNKNFKINRSTLLRHIPSGNMS